MKLYQGAGVVGAESSGSSSGLRVEEVD